MSNPQNYPILRLEHISIKSGLGNDFLLQDISCEIAVGAKVGIIGASGSGKTSFLRTLNGLVSPFAGVIHLQDIIHQSFSPVQLRQQITLVPQEPKLLGMTAIDALRYPLQLQQLPAVDIDARLDNWINLLRIPQDWLHKTELKLSLGQRQLLTIARALMMQPKILLLDEPTSALDIGNAEHLLDVLRETSQNQELTILMVNHQLELIQDFCDQIILLEAGRLVESVPATSSNWHKLSERILQYQKQQELEWM